MIGGFYWKGHGLDVEGVASSGSGWLVNFICKYNVLFERKFSVLLNILLWETKLKFVRAGHGSRVGLRKDIGRTLSSRDFQRQSAHHMDKKLDKKVIAIKVRAEHRARILSAGVFSSIVKSGSRFGGVEN